MSDFGSCRSLTVSAAPAVSRNSNSMLERANISRYCLAKYSKAEPLTPVAITTFDGGAGMKYINASETTPKMHKLAANPFNSCQRLYPSMNISPGKRDFGTSRRAELKTTIVPDAPKTVRDVRFWHKADIALMPTNVCFWG